MDLELYNSLVNRLKNAVENDNVEAMVDLADLLYQGPNMDDSNMEKALPYYKMAAEHGDSRALSKLELVNIEKQVEDNLNEVNQAEIKHTEETSTNKSEVDIILKYVIGDKITVIKAVREVLGISLTEAKGAVDNAPMTVKRYVCRDYADMLKSKLEAAGAVIELK